jgi:hypothetical protein
MAVAARSLAALGGRIRVMEKQTLLSENQLAEIRAGVKEGILSPRGSMENSV